MGESPAFLARSFSQPSGSSSEFIEGDPLRCLRTSISFGRFMSESLAWEKWSCFSNNRYLEEAEKISKPGSVAAKKAYFEAHYKRIAAKKAAALLEQQAAANNDLLEPSNLDEIDNSSSMASESSKEETHVFIDEMKQNELYDSPCVERNKSEIDPMEVAKPSTEERINPQNFIQVELSNQREDSGKSTPQEKASIMDAVNREISASTSKKKHSISSSNSFKNVSGLKVRSFAKPSPSQPNREGNATQTSKRATRDSVDKMGLTSMSLHKAITAGETTESSSTPIIQRLEDSKIVKSFVKTSKDSSTPQRTPTRVHTFPFSRANLVLNICTQVCKYRILVESQFKEMGYLFR